MQENKRKNTKKTVDEMVALGWEIISRKTFGDAIIKHPDVGCVHYLYGDLLDAPCPKEKTNGNTGTNNEKNNHRTDARPERAANGSDDISAKKPGKRTKVHRGKNGADPEPDTRSD